LVRRFFCGGEWVWINHCWRWGRFAWKSRGLGPGIPPVSSGVHGGPKESDRNPESKKKARNPSTRKKKQGQGVTDSVVPQTKEPDGIRADAAHGDSSLPSNSKNDEEKTDTPHTDPDVEGERKEGSDAPDDEQPTDNSGHIP